MSRRADIIPFDRATPAEELAGDLTWVRWLLQSVRARCEHVHFDPATLKGPDLRARWGQFGSAHFLPLIGPQLALAWNAAAARDHESLSALDADLDSKLCGTTAGRSREAGAVLLRSTRGARYQGVLGHYRIAADEGAAPAHFITVWAAVGNFFQLSLTNVLAEYLRLEWEMGTREFSTTAEPEGNGSISSLVSCVLSGIAEPSLVRMEG